MIINIMILLFYVLGFFVVGIVISLVVSIGFFIHDVYCYRQYNKRNAVLRKVD